jgi:gluconokinase
MAVTAAAWSERQADVNAYRVVVMGVSGCGKSTVAQGIAQALGLHFVEGDGLHPLGNVQRMAAGTPLTDADRHGWLQAVASELSDTAAHGTGVVVSCSALKRAYRDQLRAAAPDTRFVYLHGTPELLHQRMHERTGHYMPPSLLQSQLATLEPPGPDEAPIAIDIQWPPAAIVAEAARQLRENPAP